MNITHKHAHFYFFVLFLAQVSSRNINLKLIFYGGMSVYSVNCAYELYKDIIKFFEKIIECYSLIVVISTIATPFFSQNFYYFRLGLVTLHKYKIQGYLYSYLDSVQLWYNDVLDVIIVFFIVSKRYLNSKWILGTLEENTKTFHNAV